jgi:hypothetical protein
VQFDVHAGLLLHALSCLMTPAMTSRATSKAYRVESMQWSRTLPSAGATALFFSDLVIQR